MINCKEASILSTKKAEGGITLKERLLLLFHVKMCAICKLFDKQNKFISTQAKNGAKTQKIENSNLKLSEEDKKKMNDSIGF